MLMMTATSVPLSVMMTSSPVAATVRTTEPKLLRRSLKLLVLMCTHVTHVSGPACAQPDSSIANDLRLGFDHLCPTSNAAEPLCEMPASERLFSDKPEHPGPS